MTHIHMLKAKHFVMYRVIRTSVTEFFCQCVLCLSEWKIGKIVSICLNHFRDTEMALTEVAWEKRFYIPYEWSDIYLRLVPSMNEFIHSVRQCVAFTAQYINGSRIVLWHFQFFCLFRLRIMNSLDAVEFWKFDFNTLYFFSFLFTLFLENLCKNHWKICKKFY